MPRRLPVSYTHLDVYKRQQFTLSRAGAVVTHAKDGESAVEMFAASAPHEYDVVLMDIMMPGIDGLEATRRIRALDRDDAATTPIIAVSANAFADDRRLSREAGMNAHLSKPVSSQELVEALADVYKRQALARSIVITRRFCRRRGWETALAARRLRRSILPITRGST